MTARIGIITNVFDTRAKNRIDKLKNQGFKKIKDLWIYDIYTVAKKLDDKQLISIGKKLSNPLTQSVVFQTEKARFTPPKKFTFAIEIGFLPGVTDNIGHTAKEIIEDSLKTKFRNGEDVYSSQVTFLTGKVSEKDAKEISLTLYNPLIQRAHIKSYQQFLKDGGMDLFVPKVDIKHQPKVIEINLNISDEELAKIGKNGIQNQDGTTRGPLALDLSFMKTIQKYFKKLGRSPTDIELESLAQTWSEHCKHTIFNDPIDNIKNGLYKTYIKGATEKIRKIKGKKDFCVSVFTDNSGGISFDENYLITHKVETHNSPSALDPFGGAITGIVGVNRDTLGFGLGAKPVANFYGFCLADPAIDIPLYRNKNKSQKMLSSRRIMDGVIAGINAGGNQSGIPTPQGFVYFHEGYRGKPLVFAGTIGLIPKKIKNKPSHIKNAQPGDLIVMIGGRVGKDGVHGATFSSESLNTKSPAAAVQIGDPITQKKLSDAIINEARDQLLYSSITDNGAGGLSCSVSEMAKESGGFVLDLEKTPLKYQGLDPWEIWISESQERMTLAVPEKNWVKFNSLMKRRGVEATIIGKFTNSKKGIVKYKNKTILDIDMKFLHDGLPQRKMISDKTTNNKHQATIPTDVNLNMSVSQMLARLNITSIEFISSQYDHIVLGGAVLGPLQGSGRVNSEASVFRPVLQSQRGVVMSQALYPNYSDINPYAMAAASIDTAVRNAVAIGGNPDYIALLDNFCWTESNTPQRLFQLKMAAKACYDTAVDYQTPYISGKDSMFNEFNGFDKNSKPVKVTIPPTLLISSIGVIEDINKTVSLDAKKENDLIYILGETFDELGGSEYLSMKNVSSTKTPIVNTKKNFKMYKDFYKAIQKELIASSISIGKGGLAVAIAKKSIGGMLGVDVSLENLPGSITRNDLALFSESQGRILISIAPKNKKAFEKTMSGNKIKQIGTVTKKPEIIIKGLSGKKIVNIKLNNAKNQYKKTFKDY